MTLFIIDILLFTAGIIFLYKIKVKKDKDQEQYSFQLKSQINQLQKEQNNLISINSKLKNQSEKEFKEWKQNREKEIDEYVTNKKKLIDKNIQEQQRLAQIAISEINESFQLHKQIIQKEENQIQDELNKLKASLSAGVEARLREQEKKDKINFYRLSIQGADSEDVQKLQNLKSSFHKPVVLSKLIWTQYFQKQMTELCDRVLGKKNVCGIYKITNILTQQCYIGQSVDVAKRWKDHCKCGLGIDASSTNKLYQAMQKDKVWNFTFELLEECSKELLNEKEKFWIEMYQSNNFGYNTQKGNKI